MTPADCIDEMLARVDAALAEPEPREQPSSYPPPPINPRTTPTIRPGAKEQPR